MVKAILSGVVLATLAFSFPAQAQGVPGGAAHGFHEGNRIAGPIGAVVGTAVGGVIGGIEGVLGINHQYASYSDEPRRTYRRARVHRGKAHRAKAKKSRRARQARRYR